MERRGRRGAPGVRRSPSGTAAEAGRARAGGREAPSRVRTRGRCCSARATSPSATPPGGRRTRRAATGPPRRGPRSRRHSFARGPLCRSRRRRARRPGYARLRGDALPGRRGQGHRGRPATRQGRSDRRHHGWTVLGRPRGQRGPLRRQAGQRARSRRQPAHGPGARLGPHPRQGRADHPACPRGGQGFAALRDHGVRRADRRRNLARRRHDGGRSGARRIGLGRCPHRAVRRHAGRGAAGVSHLDSPPRPRPLRRAGHGRGRGGEGRSRRVEPRALLPRPHSSPGQGRARERRARRPHHPQWPGVPPRAAAEHRHHRGGAGPRHLGHRLRAARGGPLQRRRGLRWAPVAGARLRERRPGLAHDPALERHRGLPLRRPALRRGPRT